MAPKKKSQKQDFDLSADIDFSALAGETGLVVLRDSDWALIEDRLPMFLPNIDRAFGGGFPFGRMVEISGEPSGGKSTICFHAGRVATALGCIVVLIDVEGTADRDRLAWLGLDTGKVMVKQPDISDPDKPMYLTVEEVGRTIETALKVFKENYPDRHVVFIWDSVGQTPSEEELGKEFGEKNVASRAKAITQFVTKIAPQISGSKSLLLAINQIRDDIGGNPMFKTHKIPGGKAWEHAASLRIDVRKKKAIKKGEERIGHDLGVKTTKSKVSRPFQDVQAYLISDNGIDYEYNLAHMCEDKKILGGTSQSYDYTDRFGNNHKMKKENFVELLRTEEGQPLREELLNRLILEEFPNGYPALNNKNLDITQWMDKVWATPQVLSEQEAEETIPQTEEDVVAMINAEIKGEQE